MTHQQYFLSGCFFENVGMRGFTVLYLCGRQRGILIFGCLIKHFIPHLLLSCLINQLQHAATYWNRITQRLTLFLPIAYQGHVLSIQKESQEIIKIRLKIGFPDTNWKGPFLRILKEHWGSLSLTLQAVS